MQDIKKDSIEKKKWESPDLHILNARDTNSGDTVRGEEGMSYDPVTS
jgi:hypothetical protein